MNEKDVWFCLGNVSCGCLTMMNYDRSMLGDDWFLLVCF